MIRQQFHTTFNNIYSENYQVIFDKDIEVPENFYPHEPFIIRSILYRKKLNMNTFILTVGNPRTGKSYWFLKVAERIYKLMGLDFNPERQVTFDDIRKFLKWSFTDDFMFNLDETGTSLSPEQFWEIEQRVMRRFVQTQGYRLKCLVWTLPNIVFIQKRFRFLSNYAVQTLKQGKVNIYKIVIDHLLGKGYPEYRETMIFDLPTPETIKIYEAMKSEWNDKILSEDIDWLEEIEEYRPPDDFDIQYYDIERSDRARWVAEHSRISRKIDENIPKIKQKTPVSVDYSDL